ncbi:UNVERIFIED_CONTAM: hypothetical protein HHA_454550 [Hammondia hammondi]|eukprot:XP_008888126.1 hypothetical protein HHA_454550 [Hammondia hammondi]
MHRKSVFVQKTRRVGGNGVVLARVKFAAESVSRGSRGDHPLVYVHCGHGARRRRGPVKDREHPEADTGEFEIRVKQEKIESSSRARKVFVYWHARARASERGRSAC